MQPGIWSTAVRRENQKATRFPGVWIVGENEYRVRGKATSPKTGKVREVDRVLSPTTKPAASSAAEAAQARAQLLSEEDEPTRQRYRVEHYATLWLDGVLKMLQPSTADRYSSTIDLHIVPTLGDHFVDAVTHRDVLTWRNNQDAAPSTVNSRLRVLKTMFAAATIELNLPRDPTLGVEALPEDNDLDEDDGRLLEPAELAAFVDTARALVKGLPDSEGNVVTISPMWFAALATLAYTAMRAGEGTALQWPDIEDARIRVQRAQWRGLSKVTKGKRRRSVPLVEPLAVILREHRQWLIATQHPGLASGWVFPAASVRKERRDGSWPPVSTGSLRKPLLAVLKAIDLQGRITTHGLRRTWNNILRQVAAGEVVRSITGHVTEVMTEHYSHIGHDEKAQAATRALSLVRPPMKVGTEVGTEATESERPVRAATLTGRHI